MNWLTAPLLNEASPDDEEDWLEVFFAIRACLPRRPGIQKSRAKLPLNDAFDGNLEEIKITTASSRLTWNGEASLVQLEKIFLYPGLDLDRCPVAQAGGNLLPSLHLDFLRGKFVQQLFQPLLLFGCPRLVECLWFGLAVKHPSSN